MAAGEIAARSGFSRLWNAVGWTGSVAGFLIVSYYTMIAGWVLAYTWFFLSGNYAREVAAAAVGKFHAFIADSRTVSLWQLGFFVTGGAHLEARREPRRRMGKLLACTGAAGDSAGARGVFAGHRRCGRMGLSFAFAPDLSRLSTQPFSARWARLCFALGISAGIMIAYGAYMPWRGSRSQRAVLAVIGSIFAVSLLATVAIFPLVFHYGLNPAGGPQSASLRCSRWHLPRCREGGSSVLCSSRCSFSPHSPLRSAYSSPG